MNIPSLPIELYHKIVSEIEFDEPFELYRLTRRVASARQKHGLLQAAETCHQWSKFMPERRIVLKEPASSNRELQDCSRHVQPAEFFANACNHPIIVHDNFCTRKNESAGKLLKDLWSKKSADFASYSIFRIHSWDRFQQNWTSACLRSEPVEQKELTMFGFDFLISLALVRRQSCASIFQSLALHRFHDDWSMVNARLQKVQSTTIFGPTDEDRLAATNYFASVSERIRSDPSKAKFLLKKLGGDFYVHLADEAKRDPGVIYCAVENNLDLLSSEVSCSEHPDLATLHRLRKAEIGFIELPHALQQNAAFQRAAMKSNDSQILPVIQFQCRGLSPSQIQQKVESFCSQYWLSGHMRFWFEDEENPLKTLVWLHMTFDCGGGKGGIIEHLADDKHYLSFYAEYLWQCSPYLEEQQEEGLVKLAGFAGRYIQSDPHFLLKILAINLNVWRNLDEVRKSDRQFSGVCALYDLCERQPGIYDMLMDSTFKERYEVFDNAFAQIKKCFI